MTAISWELLREVGEEVERLKLAHDVTERAAQKAIAANGEAYDRLVKAHAVYKNLSRLLAGDPCVSKPTDRDETLAAAEGLLATQRELVP